MITRVACVDALVIVIADRVQSVRETIDARSILAIEDNYTITLRDREIASYRLQYHAIFRAARNVTSSGIAFP